MVLSTWWPRYLRLRSQLCHLESERIGEDRKLLSVPCCETRQLRAFCLPNSEYLAAEEAQVFPQRQCWQNSQILVCEFPFSRFHEDPLLMVARSREVTMDNGFLSPWLYFPEIALWSSCLDSDCLNLFRFSSVWMWFLSVVPFLKHGGVTHSS